MARRSLPRVVTPPWRLLIDAPALVRAAGRTDWVVLDCRHTLMDAEAGPRAYAEGHVPGAQHAHIDRDLSGPVGPTTGRHPLPDPLAFQATLSAWGVGPGIQVVAYDDVGGAWAARAWWLLKDHGHRDVAVLDGGLQAYLAAGGVLTRERTPARARRFEGTPGHLPTVDATTLLDRLPAAPGTLLDAREPERYRGEVEPIDPVAGHIPGAVNVSFKGNLGADGRFLPVGSLRHRYEAALRGRPAHAVAVYCGSGVTASHDVLAMHVAGFEGVALYPGSWSEWVRDPARPVARAAPDEAT